MDELNSAIFKRYAIHSFLQWFSQSLLVSFGALFMYAKTGSIGLALAAAFTSNAADLIARSPLVEYWWNVLLKRLQIRAMMIGLAINALGSLGIYFAPSSGAFSAPLLLLCAFLISLGASIYWIPSNALFFRTVGSSKAPGHYSAVISVLHIAAAVIAAVISLWLNVRNNFLFLLPLITIITLLSLLPLKGLNMPMEQPVIWKRAIRRLSAKCFWANFMGDNPLQYTGVPLVLVLLYGSYAQSVSIGALTLLLAAALGYFAGRLKDNKSGFLFAMALIGSVFVWVAYAFIKAPPAFVVLGALAYVFSIITSIGRDARVTREAANSDHIIESAVAIELTRGMGTMAGLLILIFSYVVTGTLPQFALLAGVLFVIPKGLYAMGAVDDLKKSARMSQQ